MASSAPRFEIDIYGVRELNMALASLPNLTRRKLQRRAMKASAEIVQREAIRQCPADTGNLARTIEVHALKRSRTQFGYYVKTGSRFLLGIHPDAKWYYPAAVEYGWSRGDGTTKTPNPFFRRAFAIKESQAIKAAVDSIRTSFDEATKQAHRRYARHVAKVIP